MTQQSRMGKRSWWESKSVPWKKTVVALAEESPFVVLAEESATEVTTPELLLPIVEAPVVTKKKFVVVDGASFFHPNTRRILNVSQVNWRELVHIFTKEVGEGVLIGPPLYTTHMNTSPAQVTFMERAGFVVKLIDTKAEKEGDDKFIIEQINKLDPQKVGSLVLVSNDGGYSKAASDAKDRGITVVWASTVGELPDGRRVLGVHTERLIKEEFTFFELLDITDRIRWKVWEERPARVEAPLAPVAIEEKKVVVSFRAEIPARDVTSVMIILQLAVERFNLKIDVTS